MRCTFFSGKCWWPSKCGSTGSQRPGKTKRNWTLRKPEGHMWYPLCSCFPREKKRVCTPVCMHPGVCFCTPGCMYHVCLHACMHASTCVYVCVYMPVCKHPPVEVCMFVEAGDHCWVSSSITLYCIFWAESLTKSGTHHTGEISWPASPRDFPVSSCPGQGLWTHLFCLFFSLFFFKCGSWGSNSGPHNYTANILCPPSTFSPVPKEKRITCLVTRSNWHLMAQKERDPLAPGYLFMACSQHTWKARSFSVAFKILLGQTVCSVMQTVIVIVMSWGETARTT